MLWRVCVKSLFSSDYHPINSHHSITMIFNQTQHQHQYWHRQSYRKCIYDLPLLVWPYFDFFLNMTAPSAKRQTQGFRGRDWAGGRSETNGKEETNKEKVCVCFSWRGTSVSKCWVLCVCLCTRKREREKRRLSMIIPSIAVHFLVSRRRRRRRKRSRGNIKIREKTVEPFIEQAP